MARTIGLTVSLVVLWLLLSGHLHEALLLGLGAASVLLTVYIAKRMGVIDAEGFPMQTLPRALAYLGWLLWEIVKSNVAVLRVLAQPRMPVRISVQCIQPTQKTDLGRVIHANSITLTPGTVTLAVAEDKIIVHALTEASAAGLHTGEMDRRVTAIEGR